MTRCEVTIANAALMPAKVEAQETLLPQEEQVEVALSLALTDQLNPLVAFTVDTWDSADGVNWGHRHREHWRGGEIVDKKSSLLIPMPVVVGLSFPKGATVKLTVEKA